MRGNTVLVMGTVFPWGLTPNSWRGIDTAVRKALKGYQMTVSPQITANRED